MRLLFDENLAHNLPGALADVFPASLHVRDCGLKSSPDSDVWSYASRYSFTIVTKDADFRQRSLLYGHPPKVIWLRIGNCSTRRIIALLQARQRDIHVFSFAADQSFLILSEQLIPGQD